MQTGRCGDARGRGQVILETGTEYVLTVLITKPIRARLLKLDASRAAMRENMLLTMGAARLARHIGTKDMAPEALIISLKVTENYILQAMDCRAPVTLALRASFSQIPGKAIAYFVPMDTNSTLKRQPVQFAQ